MMQLRREEEVPPCEQAETGLTMPNTTIQTRTSQSEMGALGFEETHANVIEEVRSLVETISFQTFELRDEIRSLRHRLQAICIAVEHSEFQSISHQVRDHVEGQFRMLENFIASLPERLAIRDIPESENETILLRDQLRGFSNVFEGYRGSFEYLTAEITASELKLRNHGVVGL